MTSAYLFDFIRAEGAGQILFVAQHQESGARQALFLKQDLQLMAAGF